MKSRAAFAAKNDNFTSAEELPKIPPHIRTVPFGDFPWSNTYFHKKFKGSVGDCFRNNKFANNTDGN